MKEIRVYDGVFHAVKVDRRCLHLGGAQVVASI